MQSRVNIGTQDPASYQALLALSKTAQQGAAAAGLDPLLVELVKIRTSQLNGCAFCLRMHTRDPATWCELATKRDRDAVLATGVAVEFRRGEIVGIPSGLRRDSSRVRGQHR
ncbi:carboxymuconolactone decarboxylase family protein [Nocardia sp. NPDC051570]|uniref:carboxymuconolactone decarboxylase family protein n=1 Tax=Nocardia sp. NPDC051570 TaxID=3364324 RepID=UPI0037B13521